MSYQIKELLLEDGDSPFAKWFNSLETVAAAKVRVAVIRMEQGNLSNVEWFCGIGQWLCGKITSAAKHRPKKESEHGIDS